MVFIGHFSFFLIWLKTPILFQRLNDKVYRSEDDSEIFYLIGYNKVDEISYVIQLLVSN